MVGNIGLYKSRKCFIENDSVTRLQGFVTDYFKRPLPNLTINLIGNNISLNCTTDEIGKYYFENVSYPSNYTILITLKDSFVDIKNFETNNKTIFYENIIYLDSEKNYNITLNITPVSEASVVYYYIKQAADFFNKTLNLVFDYTPVKIYLFSNSGTFFRTPDRIEIDKSNSAVNSTNAPDNRERHEFSHYAMFNAYNMLPPQCGGTYNHRGWENPSTSDSWCEGFAEFMSLVISDYNNESQPWIYSIGSGLDMEVNYKPRDGWPSYRSSEEIAVASLLWDLYDNNETYASYPDKYDDDNVSINATDMWRIMSSKYNFTVYYGGDPEERYIYYVHDLYDAFMSSGLANQTDIESIFTAHGFPNGQPDTPFNPGRH